jgi:hypothetical protein
VGSEEWGVGKKRAGTRGCCKKFRNKKISPKIENFTVFLNSNFSENLDLLLWV